MCVSVWACKHVHVCMSGHSDVSFLISGQASGVEGGRGGCQEKEASNALCIDKALDPATFAGTPGRGG